MSENEKELLRMIQVNDNPKQALVKAVVTILGYLTRPGSSGGQAAADPPEHA